MGNNTGTFGQSIVAWLDASADASCLGSEPLLQMLSFAPGHPPDPLGHEAAPQPLAQTLMWS